jgi:hypothetical protein
MVNLSHRFWVNLQFVFWIGAGNVTSQRYLYKLFVEGNHRSSMTSERIHILDQLGMVWDSQALVWNARYEQLLEYKRIHGHVYVYPVGMFRHWNWERILGIVCVSHCTLESLTDFCFIFRRVPKEYNSGFGRWVGGQK